jgi:hypothetical protein
MSLETFVQAVNELQEYASQPEGRANFLANVSALEYRGWLDAGQAKVLRVLIDWLAEANLDTQDASFVLEHVAQA